jgi:excisionase family DNA binding protein
MLYTVDEVAALLRVSARWLADQCRAERIEHVHLARQRLFTRAQVLALIESSTVRPDAMVRMGATRARVIRLLARQSK